MIGRVHGGDCRDTMPELIAQGLRVQMCVTSPPYFGLRDYGHPGQIGLEETPTEFVHALVEVFSHVRNLLADDGTLWLNLGDSYLKKQLLGMPWRVAFALQDAGWYLRQDIIWAKPNAMPESVTDRCTRAHEYMFLFSKSPRYQFDADAIKEPSVASSASMVGGDERSARDSFKRTASKRAAAIPGQAVGTHRCDRGESRYDTSMRNKRSVWTVATEPYGGDHAATFPPALIAPCILAGSRSGDVVFDPFVGSGTSCQVAQQLGRRWVGCEINEQYQSVQRERTSQCALNL